MRSLKSKIEKEQRTIEKLSRYRMILGLFILSCWVIPLFQEKFLQILYPLSFILVIVFGILVYFQLRRRDFKKYLDRRLFVEERPQKDWGPHKWQGLHIPPNPLWEDLDIFHEKALFHQINLTQNQNAAQKLVNLMALQTNDNDILLTHQKQVRYFEQKKGNRKILLTLFSLFSDSLSVDNLRQLLAKKIVEPTRVMSVLWGYYLVLWGLYAATLIGDAKPFYMLGWMGLVILFAWAATQIKVLEAYPWVNSFDSYLLRFKKTMKYRKRLGSSAPEQEAVILEMDKISSALGVRQNYIVYVIIHALVPWDFYWTLRLEKAKSRMEKHFEAWVQDMADMECFLQIAEFSENLGTQAHWPEFVSFGGELELIQVTHPLMNPEKAVANSVKLDPKKKKMLLITGSNMAGKSTFLRTIAVNQLLAQIGAKVRAEKYKTAALVVLTSLKRTDSLEDAFSTFYSEVKNLKWILTTSSERHSLYFIDEIFRGTNNRERLLGSQKYIQQILNTSSLGFITSHDLELAQMEKDFPEIFNEHFADRVEGGKMIFDYLKKPGPCPTTNALKVMELEGLF